MTDSQSLIDQVVDFFARYLSCSRDQLDLLALWTFHTHCYRNAPFSPALNIHSREKQSGKTTCLELLEMLCNDTWFHTSPSPALVIRQTQGLDKNQPFTGTLLLDECRFTAALQGVLSAAFRWSGRQVGRSTNETGDSVFDRRISFFPKAFAGNGRLPDCLRDVSIPIGLEPKQPGSSYRRFHQDSNREPAASLRAGLHQWYEEHTDRLAKMPTYKESQFPPELSSRQQDCAEPLLHIADLIGGQWPQRARNALVNAFALSAFEDFYSSKQVLGDIQKAFAAKDHPQWISTADLLIFLHTMDNRTWDEWSKGKPLNSKDLAALLAPFGIKSKNHRTGEGEKVAKGYNQEDLLASWRCHTLPELFRRAKQEMMTNAAQGSHGSVAANLQNSVGGAPQQGTGSQKLEASSVAATLQNSVPRDSEQVAGSQKLAAPPVAADLQHSELVAGSQKPVADNPKPVAKSEPRIVRSVKVYAGQQHKPIEVITVLDD